MSAWAQRGRAVVTGLVALVLQRVPRWGMRRLSGILGLLVGELVWIEAIVGALRPLPSPLWPSDVLVSPCSGQP